MPAYAEISRMPAVTRDLALVVGVEVNAGKVVEVLRAAAPAIVREIELFDVYHGKGIDPDKKSFYFLNANDFRMTGAEYLSLNDDHLSQPGFGELTEQVMAVRDCQWRRGLRAR